MVNDSSVDHPRTIDEKEAKPIGIDVQLDDIVRSVAFFPDGKHLVSGGDEQLIQRWIAEDGKEVEAPMDAEDRVYDIAVSRDGKWVVSGTDDGRVMVWNAESHEKAIEFKGHDDQVFGVDVSPDSTRIATTSPDGTACIWSLATGERLLEPLQHSNHSRLVAAVKFSPDGTLLATATALNGSIRIYDSQNGRLLSDVPIIVGSEYSGTLAWASDSKTLFALSRDGNIHCLDASTGTMLSQWSIHSGYHPDCISLASNGTFIAAAMDSCVSFWDTTTHKRIGPFIQCSFDILCMDISANYDLVIAGDQRITLRSLCDILPPNYCDDMYYKRVISRLKVENARLQERIRVQEESGVSNATRATRHYLDHKIAILEETVQQLHNQLSDAQHAANQKGTGLRETFESLRARSDNTIVHFEQTLQQFRTEFSDFQRKANDLLHGHE